MLHAKICNKDRKKVTKIFLLLSGSVRKRLLQGFRYVSVRWGFVIISNSILNGDTRYLHICCEFLINSFYKQKFKNTLFYFILLFFYRVERDRFYRKLYTTSTLPLRVVLVTHDHQVIPNVSSTWNELKNELQVESQNHKIS